VLTFKKVLSCLKIKRALTQALLFIFFASPLYITYAAVTAGKIDEQPGSDIEVTKAPVQAIEGPRGSRVDPKGFTLEPGMKIVSMNGTNIYLPEGTLVKKAHGVIYYEDIGEYLARRFEDIDKRLSQIEVSQQELKSQVQQLKQAVEEVNKRSLVSQ